MKILRHLLVLSLTLISPFSGEQKSKTRNFGGHRLAFTFTGFLACKLMKRST